MKKYKSELGEDCATWDCKGKLIEEDKYSLKCSICDRSYWKESFINPKKKKENKLTEGEE